MTNTFVQNLTKEANLTYTENGAVTNATTGSALVDLFGTCGSLRREPAGTATAKFLDAYMEDPDLAMKLLFYARDVRGKGVGERKLFREITRSMATSSNPALVESLEKNLALIPEYGRWDDLISLLGTKVNDSVVKIVAAQLAEDVQNVMDGKPVSLLGKWLPSENASSPATKAAGRKLAKQLGLSCKMYRQTCTALRSAIKIVENNLRLKDYSFDYSAIPAKALFKYRQAFWRNDAERYADFLGKVEKGEVKMNAGTLFPYDILRSVTSNWRGANVTAEERKSINTTWYAQPDYTTGENALVVVDGSGSMYGCWGQEEGTVLPANVALSLGIYYAERNTGFFKDYFITFSRRPRLIRIQGDDIVEKVNFVKRYDEVANTNIDAVYNLILETAVKNNVPQEELPSRIYIISDMEFDSCAEDATRSNFDIARDKFEAAGYKLPEIFFWNVASRAGRMPVTINDVGVVCVSGASPTVFSYVTSGEVTPYTLMLEVLNDERYAPIRA